MRSLPPTISRQDISNMCKKFDGFIRVAFRYVLYFVDLTSSINFKSPARRTIQSSMLGHFQQQCQYQRHLLEFEQYPSQGKCPLHFALINQSNSGSRTQSSCQSRSATPRATHVVPIQPQRDHVSRLKLFIRRQLFFNSSRLEIPGENHR